MASSPTDPATMADGTGQEQLYDPNFTFGKEYEFEDVEKYRPGGFCPVEVSTRDNPVFIHDRYQVMYKAKHSHFFTAWLCYDSHEKKWKNTLISQGVDRETARKHGIILPYETFFLDSPNGRHLVSVLTFFGPSLGYQRDMDQTDGDRVHQICRSMTRTYYFSSREEMFEMLSTDVVIWDIGSAYLATEERPLIVDAPESYQAPETIMDMKMGTKSDIWTLAATLIELASGAPMLEVKRDNKVEAIMAIEEIIGPAPQKYRKIARETAHKYSLEEWEKNGKARWLPKPEMPEAESGKGAKRIESVSHMVKSGEELEKRMKEDGSYQDKIEDMLKEPQKLRGKGEHSRFRGVWYLAPEKISCLAQ
ncbi:uncharacterized protein PG986_014217 [Apiospora aurea]|uniref:non-specific serine/threonine protein kinase n=1 Tax=Apiospora aurea TaxID=335848 RepID=A0ABR1PSC2_9PEZI